jgi:hypothetical protein
MINRLDSNRWEKDNYNVVTKLMHDKYPAVYQPQASLQNTAGDTTLKSMRSLPQVSIQNTAEDIAPKSMRASQSEALFTALFK